MNIQDVNHAVQTAFFAGATILTDNFFEIIGAAGVIINLAFVYRSYSDGKHLKNIEKANKLLEQKILQKKLKDIEAIKIIDKERQ